MGYASDHSSQHPRPIDWAWAGTDPQGSVGVCQQRRKCWLHSLHPRICGDSRHLALGLRFHLSFPATWGLFSFQAFHWVGGGDDRGTVQLEDLFGDKGQATQSALNAMFAQCPFCALGPGCDLARIHPIPPPSLLP